MQNELSELRKEFFDVMNIESSENDVFLFRLCIADLPKVKSLRRNLEDVLIYA
jgi:hypothetical protein